MRQITKIAMIAALILMFSCTQTSEQLRVGAILPLSGPAAIWGESAQNGLELARQELSQEIDIEVIYEDSQARAAQGVTAYNKLQNVDDVDVVFSIFSSVSVPLVALADRDEIPLIMSIVAARAAPIESEFAFRHYSTETQYVEPHFALMEDFDSIAVLYQEGSFGQSVLEAIRENTEIVAEESFAARSTDYRTQLIKIRAANPDAIMFVASIPPEAINILKQAEELGIDAQMIEASAVLSSQSVRDAAGELAEGVWTVAFPFTLGLTGEEFRASYMQMYDSEPNFAAALAYDSMILIAESNGDASNMRNIGSFEGTNGRVIVQPNGEINPVLHSVRIVNGELVMN